MGGKPRVQRYEKEAKTVVDLGYVSMKCTLVV
jgi:hypothetical protein